MDLIFKGEEIENSEEAQKTFKQERAEEIKSPIDNNIYDKEECWECGGEGVIYTDEYGWPDGGHSGYQEVCDQCEGTGEVEV